MIKLKNLIDDLSKFKKENLNEGVWEVVVGSIAMDGTIRSEETRKTHTKCGIQRGIYWRYNRKTKIVYWSGDGSEHNNDDETRVEDHIHKKYGYEVNSHHNLESNDIDSDAFHSKFMTAHGYMEESNLSERTHLTGEWWIDNHGEAMFADGDVGDMNHEAYVIQYLTNEFLNFFGLDDLEKGDLSQYEDGVAEILRDKGVLTDDKEEDFSNGPWEFVYEWLKTQDYMKDEKQLQEAILIALGSIKNDAREYALKYWKWKRMKGNVIQTQQLTPEDLKIIVSGVHNAYGDQMEDEESDPTFGLEVMTTRSWYGDVPLSVLEKKSTMALNQYRSRYE